MPRSPIHGLLATSARSEINYRSANIIGLEGKLSHQTLVMHNRNCCSETSISRGDVLLKHVLEAFPFHDTHLVVDIRGDLLADVIQRNSLFVGCADYLFIDGVEYEMTYAKLETSQASITLAPTDLKPGDVLISDIQVYVYIIHYIHHVLANNIIYV